jgi:glycosyltransferase involved in cell wall biosynthesis
MKIKKLSIVIPAYNEEKTIRFVLKKVSDLVLFNGVEKEIIVINDCSKDSTSDEINAFSNQNPTLNIVTFNQIVNQGKGAAIHKGIALATGDYIIIQDADLELDPLDINKLLEHLFLGDSNVVYGSRFLINNHSNTSFIWHILGNGFLTKLSNLVTGYKLTDMMTCYKLIPTTILKEINLKEKRFGFEPEITLKLSKIKQIKISEIAISYNARSKGEGKKINSKDGLRVIYCILKYWISK